MIDDEERKDRQLDALEEQRAYQLEREDRAREMADNNTMELPHNENHNRSDYRNAG